MWRTAATLASYVAVAAFLLLYLPAALVSHSHAPSAREPATSTATSDGHASIAWEDFASRLRRATVALQSKSREFILLTVINSAYLNLTENWLCNTLPMRGVHERALVIGTDVGVCSTMARRWPNISCVALVSRLHADAMDWGERDYVRLLTLRARLLRQLVDWDVPLLLIETDAVWLRNPLAYFADFSPSADIAVPLKGYHDKGLTLSFSPMLLRPSAALQLFLREMEARLTADATLFDQDVLDELCHVQFGGVVCATFPWDDVADGKWFKLTAGQRADARPLVVNNNYYVGVDNKIARQALNGFWFLDVRRNCDARRVAAKLGID